jgi:hypothetical protein
MAYKCAVHGFLQLLPLLKTTSGKNKVQNKDEPIQDQQLFGQLVMMMMTTRSRRYNEILHDENILISPTPLWRAIESSGDPTEIECARHFTARGVTPDELADVYQYAAIFTYVYIVAEI